MAIVTKVAGKKINFTDLALEIMRMEIVLRVNLTMIKGKDKENCSLRMGIYLKENTKMIIGRDKGHLCGRMEIHIKENS